MIYYFMEMDLPPFLLAAYAKGERADLSADDKRWLSKLAETIRAEAAGSLRRRK